MNREKQRLISKKKELWKKWGPYISERQWGTVREDYSHNGDAWNYINFDAARSKAYRWGEEAIGGVCDEKQILCFAPAFWNGKDPILKEILFGLGGPEGNHAEDVKELYYYLDSTPTHSYMKMLYKYPQKRFPYEKLYEENRKRGKNDPEFELIDTGIFNSNEYFDIFIEYAKADPEDILVRIRAFNRSEETAQLYLLPQIWFRNSWAWRTGEEKPVIKLKNNTIVATHKILGRYFLYFDDDADILFTENETNVNRLYNLEKEKRFFKDGINDCIVNGKTSSVNQDLTGTKAALQFIRNIKAGEYAEIRLRLSNEKIKNPFKDFNDLFYERIEECDEFYDELQTKIKDEDSKNIQRQALAGMMWAKQFYYFDVRQWLNGDPGQPPPPEDRKYGRNSDWFHLNNAEIISMPDKWEYPWYAVWDLAFHCLPIAMVDAEFAKEQLLIFTREWYMHPNGQLPAYEWNFGDVNPPVHAWAAWRVFKIDEKYNGKCDYDFLEKILHKLLLNFTWWVNKKDTEGHNVFQGGFLGMDNVGVFDRSSKLPGGGHLDQSDGTSWMAMYCLNLLRISIELAKVKPIYQDIASKFFEHFLYIAGAMTNIGGDGIGLWDEEDEFYYDVLHLPGNRSMKIRLRSMVSLVPLFAVEVLEPNTLRKLPQFKERMDWFLNYRPDLANLISRWSEPGWGERKLLSLLRGSRMKKLLRRMLDETEFLSDYGVRSLSKVYQSEPFEFNIDGEKLSVKYTPGESDSYMFGGNSNWRGPIWFPVNFLIIESLQRFHHYYGDDFKIEYPHGSNKFFTINDVAVELAKRLTYIFLKDENGNRPVFGNNRKLNEDEHFKDYILFYEYFNGDTGQGHGASHQTGWTGLIAKLLQPRDE